MTARPPEPLSSDDSPAVLLGSAWEMLDALPTAPSAPSMTSTTVEMVAAVTRARSVPGRWRMGWLAPAALVATAFAAGLLAGRTTRTDPDQAVFDYLPVLDHYEVVREAGSIDFLSQVARRNYPPPRRPPFNRQGDREGGGVMVPYEALDAAVSAFSSESFGSDVRAPADRRAAFEKRSADDRRRLTDAASDFLRRSSAERRDLVRLARAFGAREGEGPDRDELMEAARLWHQWLATRDPADRKGIIDLGTEDRLEWLDRYARVSPGPGRGGAFRDGGFRGFPPPPDGHRPNGPPFSPPPPDDPHHGPPPPGGIPGPPR